MSYCKSMSGISRIKKESNRKASANRILQYVYCAIFKKSMIFTAKTAAKIVLFAKSLICPLKYQYIFTLYEHCDKYFCKFISLNNKLASLQRMPKFRSQSCSGGRLCEVQHTLCGTILARTLK